MTSGSQRGTEMARVPPGRRTRTSSVIASTSAWMCSSTSAATMRSNSPSANGSWSASPCLMSAAAPAGTSPCSFMAPKTSRTFASSSASMSNATTSAPRRYISNAWRPPPAPMSRTRSPGSSPSRSKSTVSTGALLLVVGDHFFVRRGDLDRHGAPAEELLDALAAGRAVPRLPLRVVEQGRDRGLELAHVAGGDQVGAQPVGADDLRDRARVGGDQGRGAGHQLRGGKREALVEGRHAGQLGGAHQLDELRVADTVHEVDVVADRELVDELLGAATGLGLGDQEELEVALGAQLREGL